jgi:hypothetical protein
MFYPRKAPAEMDRHRGIKSTDVKIGDPAALRRNAGIVEQTVKAAVRAPMPLVPPLMTATLS